MEKFFTKGLDINTAKKKVEPFILLRNYLDANYVQILGTSYKMLKTEVTKKSIIKKLWAKIQVSIKVMSCLWKM